MKYLDYKVEGFLHTIPSSGYRIQNASSRKHVMTRLYTFIGELITVALDSLLTMPVTFIIATHPANPVPKPAKGNASLDDFLKSCAPTKTKLCTEVLQTSFVKDDLGDLTSHRNGFVDTVMNAYNKHHHLVIRC